MDRSDDTARPLMLLGLTILLVVGLLAFAGGRGDGDGSARRTLPGGGMAPLVPGAPIDGVINDPVPGGPPVTIIQDVRETLHRLPLDRNNPQGWSNPVPKPT